jgi:NitT/TauT family transport system permease protein
MTPSAPAPGGSPFRRTLGELFEIRHPTPRWTAVSLSWALTVLLLAGWWLLTHGAAEERVISPIILPSPGEVLRSFPSLCTRRHLPSEMLVSFIRVLKGFGLAVVLTVPLGLLMGSFGPVRAFFQPVYVVAGYLPLITIIPLSFAWFLPYGEEFQKVMFLAMACAFYMLPLIVRAVDDVDEVFLNTARTLGAGRWALLRKIILPVALPEIYDACRLGFGVGWTWIIVAEMLLAEHGLGYIFMTSYRFEKPHMYWTALVILLIGFTCDRALEAGGQRLFPYRYRP